MAAATAGQQQQRVFGSLLTLETSGCSQRGTGMRLDLSPPPAEAIPAQKKRETSSGMPVCILYEKILWALGISDEERSRNERNGSSMPPFTSSFDHKKRQV